jgi:hypothetical protein
VKTELKGLQAFLRQGTKESGERGDQPASRGKPVEQVLLALPVQWDHAEFKVKEG